MRVVLLQLQCPAAAEIFEKLVNVDGDLIAIALCQRIEIQLPRLGDGIGLLGAVGTAGHLVIVNQPLQVGFSVAPPFADLLDFWTSHTCVKCLRNHLFQRIERKVKFRHNSLIYPCPSQRLDERS